MKWADSETKREERNKMAKEIYLKAISGRIENEDTPGPEAMKQMAGEAFDAANIFMMVQDDKGRA